MKARGLSSGFLSIPIGRIIVGRVGLCWQAEGWRASLPRGIEHGRAWPPICGLHPSRRPRYPTATVPTGLGFRVRLLTAGGLRSGGLGRRGLCQVSPPVGQPPSGLGGSSLLVGQVSPSDEASSAGLRWCRRSAGGSHSRSQPRDGLTLSPAPSVVVAAHPPVVGARPQPVGWSPTGSLAFLASGSSCPGGPPSGRGGLLTILH